MITRSRLDGLYRRYNRRNFVHPDPLEFLYAHPDVRDREIIGLIASSLAYGRVAQILKSVAGVTKELGPEPRRFLVETTTASLHRAFSGFRHRFTDGDELVSLLCGIRRLIRRHGSLGYCFRKGLSRSDENILPALSHFAAELGCKGCYLVPLPERGSACKRLNLYLRWMVRKDAVDPGGWHGVPKSKLIVPLDTHMARIGQKLGLTSRKSPGLAMALEITESFRRLNPSDPVKYDFALTRFGIRGDMDISDISGHILDQRY